MWREWFTCSACRYWLNAWFRSNFNLSFLIFLALSFNLNSSMYYFLLVLTFVRENVLPESLFLCSFKLAIYNWFYGLLLFDEFFACLRLVQLVFGSQVWIRIEFIHFKIKFKIKLDFYELLIKLRINFLIFEISIYLGVMKSIKYWN